MLRIMLFILSLRFPFRVFKILFLITAVKDEKDEKNETKYSNIIKRNNEDERNVVIEMKEWKQKTAFIQT